MSENKLVNISIIFLGFGLLFLALREFQSFLRPFFIAIILSILFAPLLKLSAEKKKLFWIKTIGTIIGFIFVVGLVGLFLVDDSSNIDELSNEGNVQTKLQNSFSFLDTYHIFGMKVNDFIDSAKIGEIFSSFIANLGSGIGSFFTEFFLLILFLAFLLPSYNKTVRRISSKLSEDSRKKFTKALKEIENSVRKYLSIKTTVSLITAILSGIIMFIFGVKFMILFMFLIFALNFIPSIGSVLAVVVVLISDLVIGGFSGGFILLGILLILIQIVMGNIIEPKFAGKELDLSPAIILLSLFFWGSVWGIGGMFLAVPLTSIIKIVLQNIESTKKSVIFLS